MLLGRRRRVRLSNRRPADGGLAFDIIPAPRRWKTCSRRRAGRDLRRERRPRPGGTGKELLSQSIAPARDAGCRRERGAIPEGLLESSCSATEGSFTGAVADRRGLFEAAQGGTCSSTKSATCRCPQVKLLRARGKKDPPSRLARVLRHRRAGGLRHTASSSGSLRRVPRRPLHRLNVVKLYPALAERREDIRLARSHFLAPRGRIAAARAFSPEAMQIVSRRGGRGGSSTT